MYNNEQMFICICFQCDHLPSILSDGRGCASELFQTDNLFTKKGSRASWRSREQVSQDSGRKRKVDYTAFSSFDRKILKPKVLGQDTKI